MVVTEKYSKSLVNKQGKSFRISVITVLSSGVSIFWKIITYFSNIYFQYPNTGKGLLSSIYSIIMTKK